MSEMKISVNFNRGLVKSAFEQLGPGFVSYCVKQWQRPTEKKLPFLDGQKLNKEFIITPEKQN